MGGSTQYEGRLEVCIDNQWGTVCDNSWGSTDATVVCIQLGYAYTGSKYFYQHMYILCIPTHWYSVFYYVYMQWNRFIVSTFSPCPLDVAGGIAHSNAYYGSGSGPIYLTNVACTSSSTSLLQCPSDPILSGSCTHSEDAGVKCEGNSPSQDRISIECLSFLLQLHVLMDS